MNKRKTDMNKQKNSSLLNTENKLVLARGVEDDLMGEIDEGD